MKRQNLLTALIFGVAIGGWALLTGLADDDPAASVGAASLDTLAAQLSSLAGP